MSQQRNEKSLSEATWRAETLRLTAFPSPSEQIAEPTWWNDLFGEPAENKMVQSKRGLYQENGRYGPSRLVLMAQPTRIDWILTQLDDKEDAAERFPMFEPFTQSVDSFSELLLRWFHLDSCPSVQRLGFGATLFQPVDSRKEGYSRLDAYLPSVDLDLENSSDFLYRINRPRYKTYEGIKLKINRLATWSVDALRKGEIDWSGSSLPEIAVIQEKFACHLEMDINTAADFESELPQRELPRIFHDLVGFGKEIAEKGDIP